MPHLLIFMPVTPGGLQAATVRSVVGQQFAGDIVWEIGRCNPYPGRDMRNVLAQYQWGRELFLAGPHDALVTVEQDMVIPPHALQTLWDDGSPVVYGTYMLRHGWPVINALRHDSGHNLGMSLSLYAGALPQAKKLGRVQVSGVGFGCTLIRRPVLEQVPFRADSAGHAPDMPFALDCLRQGIEQIARFDVACGHRTEEGEILETDSSGGWVKAKVLQPVNVMIDGKSTALIEGDSIELPPELAASLTGLGYVALAPEPQAPAVPKRSKKTA